MVATWDYEIQLIGLVDGVDDDGFPATVEKPKEPILANKLSIRSNEYWQSQQAGIELSLTFEIHAFEYNGEEKLLFKEQEYKIERTYEKGELIELICSRRSNDHGI
ncbi:hypothetical protein [Caldifermentibacillus hisashii]|uniref:hypothetical protein n=1 Tax=Caldifermentibacillus hisashii TaxID=996558 RepID=UPI003443063E